MIADELKTQFDVELDRKKINLPQAIRDLGDHDVGLKLHADIEGILKVKVESENPLAEVEPERPAKDKPEGKDSGAIS
jgi:large subunit ribosomal protein L9